MSKIKVGVYCFLISICFAFISCNGNKNELTKNIEQKDSIHKEEKYLYQGEPLRVGVVGLTHAHVHWILGREDFGDIKIVGIVEPNRDLAERLCKQYKIPIDIVFDTMEEMVEATKPEAVTAFNSIYEHLEVVEYCAPKGIHIMVEKPLAVNVQHADKMIGLAKKHNVQLMTNYETTWYASNTEAFDLVNNKQTIGDVRRIVFYTGHQGPIEIGCNQEFLDWLTDPILNGGGALTDFGCYGANLATWIMQGEKPISVTCITQQIKPKLYPKVEDDATIILKYPKAEVVIQPSWNWPYSRKDMEVYGKTGYIMCNSNSQFKIQVDEKEGVENRESKPLPKGEHDPFAYFAKVIKEHKKMEKFSPSSIENNRIVVQILQAAKQAAATGKTINWKEYYGEN